MPDVREVYARCGVMTFSALLPMKEIEGLRSALDRITDEGLSAELRAHLIWESADQTKLRSAHWLNKVDPTFQRLLKHERLLAAVRQMVDWEPEGYSVEFFNKPAQVGSATALHQEAMYLGIDPPEYLTLWLALDPVLPDSGPVEFFVGSHHDGLARHRYTDNEGTPLQIPDTPELRERYRPVSFHMLPGDASAHDPFMIHGSGPNKRAEGRRGLGLVFKSERARFDPAAADRLFGSDR